MKASLADRREAAFPVSHAGTAAAAARTIALMALAREPQDGETCSACRLLPRPFSDLVAGSLDQRAVPREGVDARYAFAPCRERPAAGPAPISLGNGFRVMQVHIALPTTLP
jgi:hypothetical protein